jgi:hypothetical protein
MSQGKSLLYSFEKMIDLIEEGGSLLSFYESVLYYIELVHLETHQSGKSLHQRERETRHFSNSQVVLSHQSGSCGDKDPQFHYRGNGACLGTHGQMPSQHQTRIEVDLQTREETLVAHPRYNTWDSFDCRVFSPSWDIYRRNDLPKIQQTRDSLGLFWGLERESIV